jgi:hypothetical protein
MSDFKPQTGAPLAIGVYLILSLNQKLVGEGIARLLAITIEKLGKRGTRFTLFALPWSKPEIDDYIREYSIQDYVTVAYFPTRTPSLFKFWKWYSQLRNGAAKPASQIGRRQKIEEYCLTRFPLLAITFGLIFQLVDFVVRNICKLVVKLFSWGGRGVIRRLSHVRQRYYDLCFERYAILLAEYLSASAVDCAYVPNLASPQARFIRKPLVVSFPDYVPREFPELFDRTWMYLVRKNAMMVLSKASATISFCEHVRKHHAVEYCLVPENRAFLIHHGPFPADSYILDSQGRLLSREACALLLHNYVEQRFTKTNPAHEFEPYYAMALPQWDFTAQRYIMLSTQNRPYKNVLRVIRAVHQLNRRHHLNLKIIMTGAPAGDIAAYIHKHYLYEDVIALTRVPEKIHSALFRCAALAIQPSQFEGGFTATLSQAVSVGVPVLLSRMQAHTERLPYEGNEDTYFNPLSTRELSKKILWALENHKLLLEQQKKIYDQLAQRSWDDVADDYGRVFRYAIAHPRNQ